MLKRLLIGVSFLMLGAFGLQAQSSSTQSGSQQQQYGTGSSSQSGTSQDQYGTQPSNSSQSSVQLSRNDRDFIQKAFQANESEIQKAQIAVQKSANNDVKQYAQQLLDDHTKANDQLKQIASGKGINLPSTPQSSNQNQFSSLSGAAFDRQFLQSQERAHRQAIAMFRNEANSGQDPDLKSFASAQLSALQQHEKMANDLRSRMSSNQPRSSSSYAGSSAGQSSQSRDQSASKDNSMNMPSDSSSSSQSTTNNTTNNDQASNSQGQNQRLPRTASDMPLIGLLGFMLIGAALIMRSFRLLQNNR